MEEEVYGLRQGHSAHLDDDIQAPGPEQVMRTAWPMVSDKLATQFAKKDKESAKDDERGQGDHDLAYAVFNRVVIIMQSGQVLCFSVFLVFNPLETAHKIEDTILVEILIIRNQVCPEIYSLQVHE